MNRFQAGTRRTFDKFPNEQLFQVSGRFLNQLHAILGICSEAGEAADVLHKAHFYDSETEESAAVNINLEIGDVLFYVAAAADANGTKLSKVAELNTEKRKQRYPEKFAGEEE